jgi:hypothetical protein
VNTFRDHHPTVLVEDGARFAQGVFGDLEYIPFAPDHIGDAFIKLMEGIAYIRRNLRPRE